MGIQRYSASLDTTITNAYKMNLTTRATGSNMGLADTLEVFSIYGQASSASVELSRILVQFPVTDITTDRTAGTIPASGSVNFFLRMYNAEHSFTLPKDFSLNISAISSSWEEGYGLDMDEHTDLTYDDVGANWIQAGSGSRSQAILADAIDITGHAAGDKFTMTVPTSAGGDGVTYTFLFDQTAAVNADTGANTFGISRQIVADDTALRNALVDAINGTANSAVKYGDADTGAGSTLTAGTIGLTAKAGTSNSKTTLTMDDAGSDGNVANVLAAVTGFENALLLESTFTGGGNDWTTPGGDFYSDTSSSFSASFLDGTEHIETDITTLVEQWLNSAGNVLGTKTNYGLHIMFPTGSEQNTRSYYTKKFFARGSQYFLKRPTIEARWDSSKKDNQGNFFLSSSLATATENLNTIYMYNRIRGQLRNIPDSGSSVVTGSILVSIYSGSADNSAPSGSKLYLPLASPSVLADAHTNITGGYVSTGIYSASFAYASSSITTIFPVWQRSTIDASDLEYHTGSAISVNTFDSDDYNPHPSYVTKMTNLRDVYSRDEKMTRFRLHIREKDWNPNIYTKASSDISTSIIEDAYYRIYRTIDEFEVMAYGTGSTNHTRLSYDASGSYFDFPMDILEAGYMYAFRYIYKMPDGNYREQPEIFKFRVE